MKFKLYREYGALNSVPVFNAFESGIKNLGHEIVQSDEDVSVIWSVLWHGRMASNRLIYETCKKNNKPIIIIEVGNLKRNITWRICLNHINGLGEFANKDNLDPDRHKKLGISLSPIQKKRRGEVLIACQHERSLQWEGMPKMKDWTEQIIEQIKLYTSRRIIVRPHPRSLFPLKISNVIYEQPRLIPNTYDDFNIFYNYHCVINFNSGPAVKAAIEGIPVICDSSSLAGNLSGSIENIEHISLPDRDDWFIRLCHTEWTLDEISSGIPIKRLYPEILKQIG